MASVGGAPPIINRKKPIKTYLGVQKLTSEGYIPELSHPDSPGYNVTIVARKDGRAEDVSFQLNEYVLNISIQPPSGYYAEIHAKDLLYRQGYFITGGSVIIDSKTKGDIIIPLYKFENKPDLILPFQGLELIIKKIVPSFLRVDTKMASSSSFQEKNHYPMSSSSSSHFQSPSHSQIQSSTYYTPDMMQHPASYGSKSSSSDGFLW